MLAVVKKPRIELSLNGEGAAEALAWLAKKFDVAVVEDEDRSVPVEETDFWREMNANRVGNLLQAARLKKGVTQKQLAESAGIKQNMVSDYEKGRRRLTRPMAAKLAGILGVSPARLYEEGAGS
ncbi:MAG: helix-turn-helix domain-containing protein [Acidobacteriota bacterium]|jgi:ribosome-binding protein aMBF1 (putative translation factor)|nr:helix-turn-helix domain-containing protein [Acidobacteriota bacterium]